MKARVAYNMLEFAKRLKEIGVQPKVAEAQAQVTLEVIVGLIEENLATKQDFQLAKQDLLLVKAELLNPIAQFDYKLNELRASLRQEIADLRTELKQEIADVRQEIAVLRQDMVRLETTLTIRLGAMMIASISIMGVLLHFFH